MEFTLTEHAAKRLRKRKITVGEVASSHEIKPGVIIDCDAQGNVVGVEVLHVSKRAHAPLKIAA